MWGGQGVRRRLRFHAADPYGVESSPSAMVSWEAAGKASMFPVCISTGVISQQNHSICLMDVQKISLDPLDLFIISASPIQTGNLSRNLSQLHVTTSFASQLPQKPKVL